MTVLSARDKMERGPGKARPWSAQELYRLLDLGFFNEQSVELIEGEIIEMAAQSNLHAQSITLTADALSGAFGKRFWVRVQMSLDLSPYSVLDPDIAVIAGSVRDNAGRNNPTTALLVVEVSETTLAYDRNRKGSLYARAGIADYWIVNLDKRLLEVYREPAPDEVKDFGFGYQNVRYLEATDEIAPLAFPQARLKVADLLP
jgi:Uma2 family endonuclease